MLAVICDKICDYLIQKGIISLEQKGLYHYGFHQGILSLSSIGTTLLIGILMGMFWQGILYYVAYIPLRSNAGGFHAKTPLRCYGCSVILVVLVLLILKKLEISILCCMVLTLVSSIIIFILAPVEDMNKPFTAAEYKCFKKRTRIIVLIEFFMISVCYFCKFTLLANTVMLSLTTLSIMLILGKVKNKLLKTRSNRKESFV